MKALGFPTLGVENSILRARAKRHEVRDFPGPLSIKSVVEGVVGWKTGSREIVVDENSFLVLNDREPYSMRIDSVQPVATCCVFFQRGFAESVYLSLATSDRLLMEAPPDQGITTPTFLSCLYPRDRRILPRMRAIAAADEPASLWIDQQYALLARDLLMLHEDVRRQVRSLPAARESTRNEAFKRLSRAREFMHANLAEAITLSRIARAACLSTYYFHRLFTCAFGESPHAYLTRIRLERAHWLIAHANRPLIEICTETGFQSLGSFSTLFRRHFGAPPGAFRKTSK